MGLLLIILTILALSLFEIITSIDNAIINAEVLSTVNQKTRHWFLTWGIFIAVFLVRGLLPLLIVWAAIPGMGLITALVATLSGDPSTAEAIKHSSPMLLIGGGTFLIFLFFHWLFLEPKNFGLRGENFFQDQGPWFFSVVSIFLLLIVWLAQKQDTILVFGAVVGSTAFFIIHGFREFASQREEKLLTSSASDISKILYLEVLDATFSIDGVIGAFAFTFSVLLILIGNGLGAIVLRKLTVSNIERIKKYRYLKNGAMYSILILGVVMLLESFSFHLPPWISPIVTFLTVGYFLHKSRIDLKSLERAIEPSN